MSDLLEGPRLKTKLDGALSPIMERIGLVWRGDYHWLEPGSPPLRKAVHFLLLKGGGAVLSWGVCLNFVPLISGQRLVYHGTFKTAKMDVFEWPDSYSDSFVRSERFDGVECSTDQFDASLARHSFKVLPAVHSWLGRMNTIDDVEAELLRQINSGVSAHRLHSPRQQYVLAFIQAAKGDAASGARTLRSIDRDDFEGAWGKLETALSNARAKFLKGTSGGAPEL